MSASTGSILNVLASPRKSTSRLLSGRRKEVDIWACASCESSNEAIDNKIKEINAKVDEVKKDVTQLGDKQDKVELREQVMATRVDNQDSYISWASIKSNHPQAQTKFHNSEK